jgi:hypothetical protein
MQIMIHGIQGGQPGSHCANFLFNSPLPQKKRQNCDLHSPHRTGTRVGGKKEIYQQRGAALTAKYFLLYLSLFVFGPDLANFTFFFLRVIFFGSLSLHPFSSIYGG